MDLSQSRFIHISFPHCINHGLTFSSSPQLDHKPIFTTSKTIQNISKKGNSRMIKPLLACCKVYISESRNKSALASIEKAAKLFPEAPIINKFDDESYNRIGYTLVSKMEQSEERDCLAPPLKNAVFEMVKAALETINLELHCGTHPRLGVVDHVCFHPLGEACLEDVAGCARSLAADVGSSLQVPTFLYGDAHQERMPLDSIRRQLGYFKPNSNGNQWVGGPNSEPLNLEPNEGPGRAFQQKGVMVIGATRWVDNYNIPVFANDISDVRKIAKRISGRGGGLPTVQSMALAHGEGVFEVACNLLDPTKVGGDLVQLEVERLATEEGVTVGQGYYTDLSQENVVKAYMNLKP